MLVPRVALGDDTLNITSGKRYPLHMKTAGAAADWDDCWHIDPRQKAHSTEQLSDG